jgi:hypothetical protein
MKKDIQDVIGDKSRLKPNAPATVKKKGHDKPLIDTGHMQTGFPEPCDSASAKDTVIIATC